MYPISHAKPEKTVKFIYKYVFIHINTDKKMAILINKKDLIGINKEIGENGELQNGSSLEYALSIIKHKKSWLYELSYLLRSLLVDHAFKDGNKRTALMLVVAYLKDKNIDHDKDDLSRIIWNISKKNITDINKIGRLIKSAIILG